MSEAVVKKPSVPLIECLAKESNDLIPYDDDELQWRPECSDFEVPIGLIRVGKAKSYILVLRNSNNQPIPVNIRLNWDSGVAGPVTLRGDVSSKRGSASVVSVYSINPDVTDAHVTLSSNLRIKLYNGERITLLIDAEAVADSFGSSYTNSLTSPTQTLSVHVSTDFGQAFKVSFFWDCVSGILKLHRNPADKLRPLVSSTYPVPLRIDYLRVNPSSLFSITPDKSQLIPAKSRGVELFTLGPKPVIEVDPPGNFFSPGEAMSMVNLNTWFQQVLDIESDVPVTISMFTSVEDVELVPDSMTVSQILGPPGEAKISARMDHMTLGTYRVSAPFELFVPFTNNASTAVLADVASIVSLAAASGSLEVEPLCKLGAKVIKCFAEVRWLSKQMTPPPVIVPAGETVWLSAGQIIPAVEADDLKVNAVVRSNVTGIDIVTVDFAATGKEGYLWLQPEPVKVHVDSNSNVGTLNLEISSLADDSETLSEVLVGGSVAILSNPIRLTAKPTLLTLTLDQSLKLKFPGFVSPPLPNKLVLVITDSRPGYHTHLLEIPIEYNFFETSPAVVGYLFDIIAVIILLLAVWYTMKKEISRLTVRLRSRVEEHYANLEVPVSEEEEEEEPPGSSSTVPRPQKPKSRKSVIKISAPLPPAPSVDSAIAASLALHPRAPEVHAPQPAPSKPKKRRQSVAAGKQQESEESVPSTPLISAFQWLVGEEISRSPVAQPSHGNVFDSNQWFGPSAAAPDAWFLPSLEEPAQPLQFPGNNEGLLDPAVAEALAGLLMKLNEKMTPPKPRRH